MTMEQTSDHGTAPHFKTFPVLPTAGKVNLKLPLNLPRCGLGFTCTPHSLLASQPWERFLGLAFPLDCSFSRFPLDLDLLSIATCLADFPDPWLLPRLHEVGSPIQCHPHWPLHFILCIFSISYFSVTCSSVGWLSS